MPLKINHSSETLRLSMSFCLLQKCEVRVTFLVPVFFFSAFWYLKFCVYNWKKPQVSQCKEKNELSDLVPLDMVTISGYVLEFESSSASGGKGLHRVVACCARLYECCPGHLCVCSSGFTGAWSVWRHIHYSLVCSDLPGISARLRSSYFWGISLQDWLLKLWLSRFVWKMSFLSIWPRQSCSTCIFDTGLLKHYQGSSTLHPR